MLMKILILHFMQYCASAFKWAAKQWPNAMFSLFMMIEIRTLNLRIPCARQYPIEPLLNLNCSPIHMVKMSIDKHPENSKHTFLKWIKGFLKSKYLKNLWNAGEIKLLFVV
jgi:hypothetical protein